jgi:hypothetical protein
MVGDGPGDVELRSRARSRWLVAGDPRPRDLRRGNDAVKKTAAGPVPGSISRADVADFLGHAVQLGG